MDKYIFRVVASKHCSETMQSLDDYGVEYLLKLNEYLDTLDYLDTVKYECESDEIERQRAEQQTRR